MSYFDTVNVRDASNTVLNPATVEVQTNGSQKTQLVSPEGVSAGVTTTGRIKVEATSGVPQANVPVQLVSEGLSAPVRALEWQDVIAYTVPSGYHLSCADFQGNSAQAADTMRMIRRIGMGSYDLGAASFTGGADWTLPQFGSKLYVYVTTIIGGTADVTLTVTYVNQDNVAGRQGTVLFKKKDPVGSRKEVTLQSGDYGVLSVTSVSRSTSNTGVVAFEGTITLAYLLISAANTGYDQMFSGSPVYVMEGQTATLQYSSSSGTPKARRISLIGTLVPKD